MTNHYWLITAPATHCRSCGDRVADGEIAGWDAQRKQWVCLACVMCVDDESHHPWKNFFAEV